MTTTTKQSAGGAGEHQAVLADGLAKEQPRIAAAVKNYLAYKLAQAQTMSSTDLSGTRTSLPTVTVAPAVHVTHIVARDDDSTPTPTNTASASASSAAAASSTSSDENSSTIQVKAATLGVDRAALLLFARSVLQAVTAFEMPDAQQWGALHPQTEDELAMDRLDDLSVCKVIHRLWSHVRAANAKATNLLGRSFLRFIWADMVASGALDNRLDANLPNMPKEERQVLVTEFEDALFEEIKGTAAVLTVEGGLGKALGRLCSRTRLVKEEEAGDETRDEEEDVIEVVREEEEEEEVGATEREGSSLLAELVWATNVDVVLQARSEDRRRRASVQAKQEEEQYAQDLKTAMGGLHQ